ncbi:UDP-N-acetylmuramoyl-tripeptide--D-alanyl-D-alanine ligase [Candidatus Parcubacteria bacterium]|nr:UDP-N-acetylmuramoyl-tripeptide--D-alanyl-D-alanine ligase [Candidatus Parcubacteria bacterium]
MSIFLLLFVLISVFWFVRTTKAILFWLYLWQLKEYHIGRFKAHFQTYKGKHLIFNKLLLLKIILLLSFLFSSVLVGLQLLNFVVLLPSVLFFLYLLESAKTLKDFFQIKLKKPVLTKKTIPILVFTFVLFTFIPIFLWQKVTLSQVIYDYPPLYRFCFWLLLIDILVPIIVSLIVLAFQPFTVLLRNRILEKAKKKREKFKDLLVIGITGSYGKTSTKEFLYSILSEKYKNKILKTKEHQNSEIGISQCILNDLKPKHQIFICEMGAYNRGGIKLLCGIAKPKIGILTGINEQHLATFGSQENIIRAKFELIESLPEDGIAFFNAKNKYCVELYEKTRIKKILYGQEIAFSGQENILGAIAVAKEIGMDEKDIMNACEKIKDKIGGIELKKGINGLNIIDATYSANPDSVISHLEYLKTWKGRKILIMPCLIELGKVSKEVHQRIGKKIAEVCDLAIITTKECFDDIKGGAKLAIFIEDPKKIFEKIKDFNKLEDIILLESRVPKELIELLSI